MSGGLDSTLATKLVLDQGIEMIGLYLDSPFGCRENVDMIAKHLGIRLIKIQKGMDYVELVRHPKYGYGKNMNPCIDCRVYMFRIAQGVMKEQRADFIVTGEVLGQRPMSQRRESISLIDRNSQVEDRILRPLSARHFPPTYMEREGWVDREKLLKLSGRSRTKQLKWAEDLKLSGYSSPAGGCLLTDANFSKRLSAFFERVSQPTMTEVRLIRIGRHFDLSGGGHVVIGRNEAENKALWRISEQDVRDERMHFFHPRFSAPDAVFTGSQDRNAFNEVGKLIVKYAKKDLEPRQTIEVMYGEVTTLLPVHVSKNPESSLSNGLSVLP